MAIQPFNWTCKFCGQPTTITDPNFHSREDEVRLEGTIYGLVYCSWRAISCPNPDCKKISFNLYIYTKILGKIDKYIKAIQILPESEAKPQPDYILEAIRNDYYEACRIRDLSPKASASLSRRCLQGMIRDFWKDKIKPGRLVDEIDAIEKHVDPTTRMAIDSVRKIGNIGGHMEKDVNLIVDIEPNEAQLLIGLIETLFEDWYVDRHEKEKRMKALIDLAEQKDQDKKGNNQSESPETE